MTGIVEQKLRRAEQMPGMLRINLAFRTDPTRTTGLRERFVRQMNKRFNALIRDIRISIVENDCFGIQPELLRVLSPIRTKAYEFLRDPQKVEAFMSWLEKAESAGILERVIRPGLHAGLEASWTDLFIDSAYSQGMRRARAEMRRKGYRVPLFEEIPGGISAAMNQPFHADRVGLIYTRTYEDLKSVTQVMNAQIRRQIADGLTTGLATGIAEGKSPVTIARELVKDVVNRVDKIGKTRARTIARTEVIRAHHQATIAEYEQAAEDMEVEVMAEWSTAGYEVCPICIDLENGGPYPLKKIEGMLPAHPNSYASGTEIYTQNGFTPVEAIKVGDECLSLDPKTFDLQYVPVIGTFAHKEEQMVQFRSRTFDMLVTTNHQMFTLRREHGYTSARSWEFIEAQKVPTESIFYRSSKWTGNSEPEIVVNGLRLKTEIFAEFMGWWLSDGYIGRNIIAIAQSLQVNEDKYDRIAEICAVLGTIKRGPGQVRLENQKLYEYLKPLGTQPHRYIPQDVKALCPSYLRILLDAFAAGDGHIRKSKPWKGGNFGSEIIHTTCSRRMADDLGECILKAGKCPSFYLSPRKGKVVKHKNGEYAGNVDMWYIRECRTQRARLGRVRRSVVDYRGIAYCVELERLHTLWVRRNGKTAWGGNCRCCALPVLKEKT